MLPIIIGIVAAFFAVLLVRTLRFKPVALQPMAEAPVEPNEEKIIRDMQDMVRCKTISYRDPSRMDLAEFEKFQALLVERFPLIHQQCTLQKLGRTGLLYHLPGKNHEKVGVCMAHYDVVPAEEADWEKPAFEGILEDGVIWGRGTLDTKVTLCGVMEALEALLQ